jgi:hypothetical protein
MITVGTERAARSGAAGGAARHPRAAAAARWRDGAIAGLIFIVTASYVALLPHNLAPADESVHLYDAKRLLHGAVMYRDVFNDITPGWMYLMALLFGVFGTNVAVARNAMAVMHGITAVLLYATCRALGVRRGLSWVPAVAYLVVCQSAWPVASQHWLSTLFATAALGLCALHLRQPVRWTLAIGIVLGLFVAVQQQRAAIMTVGVAVWLALDQVVGGRAATRQPMRALFGRLLWVAAGIALVDVPLLGWLVARAGFARVWRALVIFPLFDYAGVTHCPWGDVNIMSAWQASFTIALLLKYLPLALLPAAARLMWLLRGGRRGDEARRLVLLIVTGATSVLSISYFPDFVHIAFIAPVFFIAAAESAEWAVSRIPLPQRPLHIAGAAVGGLLVIACAVRLQHNRTRLREAFPYSRDSAFGRVDMKRDEALLYDRVKQLMSTTSSRYLYCYPVIANLYLMLDVDNPTAHGFFVPGYSGPDLVQEVIDSLTATQPPYIVYLSMFHLPNDPVATWITEHYEPVDANGPVANLIFRRKNTAS